MPHIANRYRRTAKMKTSAGTTRAAPPANLRWSGETLRLCTRKAGRVRFWTVSTAAANTSFHETMNAKTAEAAMPGRTSGSTTAWKTCQRVQPSVHAASSSFSGAPEHDESVIEVADGMVSDVKTPGRD